MNLFEKDRIATQMKSDSLGIDFKDVQIDYLRCGSWLTVRVKHIPSGIQIQSDEEEKYIPRPRLTRMYLKELDRMVQGSGYGRLY